MELNSNLPIDMIICGDALGIMSNYPDQCIDLVLTDPPYNVNLDYDVYKDDLPQEDYINFCSSWFSLARKISRSQIVFTGNVNAKMWIKEFEPDYIGIWDNGEFEVSKLRKTKESFGLLLNKGNKK